MIQILGMILALCASGLSMAASLPAGKIKLTKGQVFILGSNSKVVADPEGKRGRSTQAGSTFFVGETIQTRADGRVKLEFVEGGNEVVLGPDTVLTIERTSTDPKNVKGTSLSLARGEVRSNVNQKYSGQKNDIYEVKTPNAVAGVRGTIFTATFDAKTFQSQVATERGSVFVQMPSGSGVAVNAGMFTATNGQNTIAPPRPIASNPDLSKAVQKLAGPSMGAGQSNGGSVEASAGTKADTSAPLSREPVQENAPTRSPASSTPNSSGNPSGPTSANPPPNSGAVMGEAPGSTSSLNTSPISATPTVNNVVGNVIQTQTNTVNQTNTTINNVLNQRAHVTLQIK